eukprot:scaffold582159_cov79-Attheya_sp.AAC.2
MEQSEMIMTSGTMTYAMQPHEHDPTSTIALEIKRAKSLFSTDNASIQQEIMARLEVVAFWMMRDKLRQLDVVHCISEFTSTNTIGAPHPLKQKIIGFMGDCIEEQNPPGLLAPDNVFAAQRGRAPTLPRYPKLDMELGNRHDGIPNHLQ